MDKIIEKFYNGSIPNGGYNKPRLNSNKFSANNKIFARKFPGCQEKSRPGKIYQENITKKFPGREISWH